jgi:anti-sigma-K factor RskA
LRLVASGPLGFDSTHDLEIWVLPAGAAQPVSLGLMSAAGRSLAQDWQGPAQLLISREPRGGSPTGLPTGPVIYKGSLSG